MPSEKKKYLSGNLDQMALSLSGGGVRAVGFHLGTMSARQPPAPSGKRDMIKAMANVYAASMKVRTG